MLRLKKSRALPTIKIDAANLFNGFQKAQERLGKLLDAQRDFERHLTLRGCSQEDLAKFSSLALKMAETTIWSLQDAWEAIRMMISIDILDTSAPPESLEALDDLYIARAPRIGSKLH